MFMTLATYLVARFNCYATADILTKFYSNVSCFLLLLLYLGNSQVSVYRTIGPTLVKSYFRAGPVAEWVRALNFGALNHSICLV